MAAANYGGHEYSFIDNDDCERFDCNICTKVLKDPHITKCCGQHFCETCLKNWFAKHGKKSCPHCRAKGKELQHFLDKKLKREINCLRIHCTNKEHGCQWIGELESLKDHLKSDSGCGYVEVECPRKCSSKLKRKDLATHQLKCLLRPCLCNHCGFRDTYQNITGFGGKTDYHLKQCPELPLECPNKCGIKDIKRKNLGHHSNECPLEPVKCPFEEVGCSVKLVRRELKHHKTVTWQQHQRLVKMEMIKLKRHNMELREANDVHKGTILQLTQSNSTLNGEVLLARQENIRLQKEVSETKFTSSCAKQKLQQQLSKLKQEHSAAKQENSKLQEEVAKTKVKSSKLQQEVKQESTAKQKLQQQLSKLKQEHSAERSTFQKKMLRMEQEAATMKYDNTQLREANTELGEICAALSRDNSTLEERNAKLQYDVLVLGSTFMVLGIISYMYLTVRYKLYR